MDYTCVDSAWGTVLFAADRQGLAFLQWPVAAPAAQRVIRDLFGDAPRTRDLLPDLQDSLRDYFAGRAVEFDVPLNLAGMTPFQQAVLRAAYTIPFGDTLSYAQLAALVGKPAAARAVGGVMARNPIPLVIPCHRVVASGGKIGGFSAPGGLNTKRRLLDHEADVLSPRSTARSTTRPQVSLTP